MTLNTETCPHGQNVYAGSCTRCDQAYEAEQQAKIDMDTLSHRVNGMSHVYIDAYANALANEHPTLSGQMAKAFAIGIVRRAVRDEAWKPWDTWERTCPIERTGMRSELTEHPDHDGRHSCELVAGAVLMARQFYV